MNPESICQLGASELCGKSVGPVVCLLTHTFGNGRIGGSGH
jgi:hypothetical protein